MTNSSLETLVEHIPLVSILLSYTSPLLENGEKSGYLLDLRLSQHVLLAQCEKLLIQRS